MLELFQDRSLLSIHGQNSLRFLNNMVTNDLSTKTYCYSYMISPQGRFLYDFFIYKISNEEFWIDVNSSFADGLLEKLSLYNIRKDVQIENITSNYCILYSSAAPETNDQIIFAYQDPRFHKLGFRLLTKPSYTQNLQPTSDNLYTSDTSKVGSKTSGERVERILIREHARIPKFDVPNLELSGVYLKDKYDNTIPDGVSDLIFEQSMIVHFGAEELAAVSYSKGCYIGQEVVSRAKHQGTLRKKLFKIISGTEIAPMKLGDNITDLNGDKIGIFCSSHKNLGIALLDEEKYLKLDKKTAVMNDNQEAVIEVPLWRR